MHVWEGEGRARMCGRGCGGARAHLCLTRHLAARRRSAPLRSRRLPLLVFLAVFHEMPTILVDPCANLVVSVVESVAVPDVPFRLSPGGPADGHLLTAPVNLVFELHLSRQRLPEKFHESRSWALLGRAEDELVTHGPLAVVVDDEPRAFYPCLILSNGLHRVDDGDVTHDGVTSDLANELHASTAAPVRYHPAPGSRGAWPSPQPFDLCMSSNSERGSPGSQQQQQRAVETVAVESARLRRRDGGGGASSGGACGARRLRRR